MNWTPLTSEEEFENAISESHNSVVAIFKHSTRCAISSVSKHRLDSNLNKLPEETKLYYLDLLQYRSISNLVADRLQIMHQSPQLIVLRDGLVVDESSHLGVNFKNILKHT